MPPVEDTDCSVFGHVLGPYSARSTAGAGRPAERKQFPPLTLSLQKMADLHIGCERVPARQLFLDAQLTRMVSELTRDVERFDSLIDSQRCLLQQATPDGQTAERQWRRIHSEIGRITSKIYCVINEIALPSGES